jgi:predicted AAA+ superfamily ATPase
MYIPRIVDKELEKLLVHAGGVLIKGPKACGKTETARRIAHSEITIDQSDELSIALQTDPSAVLRGDTPRLIDEWQERPALWNNIRHEIDNRKEAGQFILTGSSTPAGDVNMHSGAGRIVSIHMRPMTWSELGWSSNHISFRDVMNDDVSASEQYDLSLDETARRLFFGGWPSLIGADAFYAYRLLNEYISLIAEVDIGKVSANNPKRRDPVKVKRLMQSIARNVGTQATLTALAKDAGGSGPEIAHETITDYMDALTRLMVLEDLPVWNTHLRSSAQLRKLPKRHFVDPSLALAALGVTPEKLPADLNYMGFVFESCVLHNIRVFADSLNGKVFHYRDSYENEIDMIVELPDTSWAAFEVKMGFGAISDAVRSLAASLQQIDMSKVGKPKSVNVITAAGYAHKRPDGINVIPLCCLGA